MLSTVWPCQEQGLLYRPSKECSGRSAPNQREACMPHDQSLKTFALHERVGEDGDAGPGQASHRFTVVRCVLNYLQSKQ